MEKYLAMHWIDYKKVYNIVPNAGYYTANLESGIDSRTTKFSRGKDIKKYIAGGCTITITICDSHDVIQSHP